MWGLRFTRSHRIPPVDGKRTEWSLLAPIGNQQTRSLLTNTHTGIINRVLSLDCFLCTRMLINEATTNSGFFRPWPNQSIRCLLFDKSLAFCFIKRISFCRKSCFRKAYDTWFFSTQNNLRGSLSTQSLWTSYVNMKMKWFRMRIFESSSAEISALCEWKRTMWLKSNTAVYFMFVSCRSAFYVIYLKDSYLLRQTDVMYDNND